MEEDWIIEPQDYLYLQYSTPFHIAAWCGYSHLFTLIHDEYPSVWNQYIAFRDILGDLPLHVCFFSCDSWQSPMSDVISLSILNGADFSEYNALGMSPLHIACICNQQSGVSYLLVQHVDLKHPIHFCGDDNFSGVLDNIDQIRDVCNVKFSSKPKCFCEDVCCSCSYDGSMSWHCLCSEPSFEEYHDCLTTKQDAPFMACSHSTDEHYALEGYTALHLSLMCDAPRCAFELLQSVDSLLQERESVPSPLQVASLHSMALFSFFSCEQSHELFALLPKLWNQRHCACNPSQDLLPFTILNCILSSNYLSLIRILSTQVNLASSCFSRSFNPLHIACILLNETLIRLLLGYGADVREVAAHSETCLHLIVKSQSRPRTPVLRATLLGLLLMAGCDPSLPDEAGYTPLWYAVRQGDLRCVSVLLAYGADPTVCQDSTYSRNAFHEALRLHNEDIARLIVKKNRNILNVPDSQGWYPLHYVIENGNIQLMVYLLNHTVPLKEGAVNDMKMALQDNRIAFKHWVSVIAPLISNQIEVINVALVGGNEN